MTVLGKKKKRNLDPVVPLRSLGVRIVPRDATRNVAKSTTRQKAMKLND